MSPEKHRVLIGLLDQWNRQTMALSSVHTIMAHPNVQVIRDDFGLAAMSELLVYVRAEPFWGLMHLIRELANDEITIAEHQRGVHSEILSEIMKWGESKGFITYDNQ